MKALSLNVLLFFFFSTCSIAQNALTGTWVRPPAEGEYFQYEGLIFTEDGYFYAEAVYSEYQEFLIPEFSLGIYQFDGYNLQLYDMKEDKYLNYTISNFVDQQFLLTNVDDGKSWVFSYRGSPEINETIQTNLISWENYRRLGGSWRSETSVIKAIPSLGIIIIRNTSNPDYFNWGFYSINNNDLTITEISAEQRIIYQGILSNFDRSGLTLTNSDGPEYFSNEGDLNLDEQELMMVHQYMQMNHRLSMSTIDMMDGTQDFIWKRVKE